MEYINGTTDFKLCGTCIAMGKFDGMHMGHRFLFNELGKYKGQGLISVIFTFDYHPYNFFTDKKMPLIYTEEEKRLLLDERILDEKFQAVPDVFLSYPFTKETASMEPEDFIKNILVEKLGVKVIVIGEDFHFGKNRRGNAAMLKEYSGIYGYELKTYKKLMLNGKVISSSLIREELDKGNIAYVNQLLSNPFTIIGKVIHGRKLGRTLGMPTINLMPHRSKLLPPNGVYISTTKIDNRVYNGVTNIGVKPTVTDEMIKGVETYLFGFDEEIYDKNVAVELHEFIRNEMKFTSEAELIRQVNRDIAEAENYFA